MGDLQDIDTGELNEMDEEISDKDIETPPSETEGSSMSPLTTSAFTATVEKILEKDSKSKQSIDEPKLTNVEASVHRTSPKRNIDEVHLSTENVDKAKNLHGTCKVDSDKMARDAKVQKTEHKIIKNKGKRRDISDIMSKDLGDNNGSANESTASSLLTWDVKQQNKQTNKTASSKETMTKPVGVKPEQKLCFGNECETSEVFGKTEELNCDIDKLETADFYTSEAMKCFGAITSAGEKNVHVLDNYDECDSVQASAAEGVGDTETELGYKTVETKNVPDLRFLYDNFKTGEAAATFDEVDANFVSSLLLDSDASELFANELNIGWDNGKFQGAIDPCMKNYIQRDTHSPSWKQEIIDWNLRDFDINARQNIMPHMLHTEDETSVASEVEQEAKIKESGCICKFCDRLSDEIIGDALQSLSEISETSVTELITNLPGEDDKDIAIHPDVNLDNSTSAVSDIYSCASYSDFCRELEASGSVIKGIGISFEQKSEDSISIDDRPDDEFPLIQICESDDLISDANEDSEKYICDESEKNVADLVEGDEEWYEAIKSVESGPFNLQENGYHLETAVLQEPLMEVLECENLPSLEDCEDIVLNRGLSEDQEYHEIMAALANEQYHIDDQEFVAGTAQDYGLVAGSDIEEGATSLEYMYSDGNLLEDECKLHESACVCT